MYKVIALCGPSGSGKDTLVGQALKTCPALNKIIPCTTRPMRENETDGNPYWFYSEDEFFDLILSDLMFETQNFRGWLYGTSIDGLKENTINIGAFSPNGVQQLTQNENIQIYTVLIKCPDKERMLRQLNRETNPDVAEIARRFLADKKDFEHFVPDLIIPNHDRTNLNDTINTILERAQDKLN